MERISMTPTDLWQEALENAPKVPTVGKLTSELRSKLNKRRVRVSRRTGYDDSSDGAVKSYEVDVFGRFDTATITNIERIIRSVLGKYGIENPIIRFGR